MRHTKSTMPRMTTMHAMTISAICHAAKPLGVGGVGVGVGCSHDDFWQSCNDCEPAPLVQTLFLHPKVLHDAWHIASSVALGSVETVHALLVHMYFGGALHD